MTGFRLLPGQCPPYSLLLRLLLWLLPLLLTLPTSLLSPPLGPSLAAGLLLILTLSLRLISHFMGGVPGGGGGEGEDEELVWDGARGAATWAVLLPPRNLAAGLILQVRPRCYQSSPVPAAACCLPGRGLLLPGPAPCSRGPGPGAPMASPPGPCLAHGDCSPPVSCGPTTPRACHLQVTWPALPN